MAETAAPPFNRPDRGFNDLAGWSWIGTYGGYFLQSDLLAGFEHGFFTRQWQGRDPADLVASVSAGVSVHRTQQVHGNRVLPASHALDRPWPKADGLVSDAGGQSLWVCGADCTPTLIADPCTGRVAACHAGWRGVAGRILAEAIMLLEKAGSHRSDLLVALGPAVSGLNYQVQKSVSVEIASSLRKMETPASSVEEQLSELIACGALLEDPEPDRDRLDIRIATRRQLHHEGIEDRRISICPLCTFAQPQLFHSWRRDQVKAVQWSGIVAQA